MALRTSVYALITVQFFELLSCRLVGVSYRESLLHKIKVAALVIACGATCLWEGDRALGSFGVSPVASLLAAGVLYVSVLTAIVFVHPRIAGVTRAELASVFQSGRFWSW
jgi:hypothetical protein